MAAFKAPEQLLGEASTPAADVYAWGGVVHRDPARRPTAQLLLTTLVAYQSASPAAPSPSWYHRPWVVLPLLLLVAALAAGTFFAL